MNKAQVVQNVVKLSGVKGLSKAAAEKIVNGFLEAVKRGVKKDGNVQLVGFGTFRKVNRKARTGRNPQTGEKIKIKASRSVGFKVGKAFKSGL